MTGLIPSPVTSYVGKLAASTSTGKSVPRTRETVAVFTFVHIFTAFVTMVSDWLLVRLPPAQPTAPQLLKLPWS